MKGNVQRNKRISFFLLIIACFLTLQIKDFYTTADANQSTYNIRLLEITDTGISDLSSLKIEQIGILVETMSMKKFVAMRTDIDGLYDAIYIGRGVYSTQSVQGKNHNTKAVMNDITKLKANEIINNYINKGLTVFIHTQPFDEQQGGNPGNLYQFFQKYRYESPQTNVVFMDDTSAAQLVTELNEAHSPYLTYLKQRPRLKITNKDTLIDYEANLSHIYNIGDELNFEFEVSNRQDFAERPVTANLYLTVDKSVKLSKEQVVATTTLKEGPSGKITYKLPKTYSGPLYWKLEIVDQLNPNQLKDYDTGSIRFRGKKTVVHILQVLPSGETSRTSSLLNTDNMNQSFLKNEDYELDIQTKTMTEFNDYVKASYASNQNYGLNGTYDMLLFGFADIYNTRAAISPLVADAVVEFGEQTKQSVMFTHDTIYASAAQWRSRFQNMTGQMAPETNLGLHAPNKSNTVVAVNSGLLTEYPFHLDKTDDKTNKPLYRVAQTHNQYFTLDLEDESLVSWYNIVGSGRDTSDSWNHYYTYSKGNVTYSGTGHIFVNNSTEKFPDWEQKLFVNTMYRAFTGANHAPEITILSPQNNSIRPSYQKELAVSYTVDDWDFKDRNVTTSIRFKANDELLPNMTVDNKSIITGQTVTHAFKNPLPDGGKLEIEITAQDRQGAKAVQTLSLTIEKKSVLLETNRNLSGNVINNELKKNEDVSITYHLIPKAIPYNEVDLGLQGKPTLILSDLQYSETFPPGLEIRSTPAGTTTTGTISSGYQLRLQLSDITYQLSEQDGAKMYVPQKQDPVAYTITARPMIKGIYLLDQSRLDYEDIHLPADVENSAKELSALFEDMGPLSTLGLPADLSLYALHDVKNSGFTFDGRVIAGGDITLNGFGVGMKLDNSASSSYSVVAVKSLNLGNGTIAYGKAAYGKTLTTPQYHNYRIVHEPDIYVDGVNHRLSTLSEQLSQLPATAQPVVTNQDPAGCQLKLDGKDAKRNIFSVNYEVLAKSRATCISAPAGSTVIVNVDGATATMSGGLTLTGVDSNHVLYNFYNATSVSTTGIKIFGSILAPKANYTLHGDVVGTVVVQNMAPGGGFSIQNSPFQGDIVLPPTEPETPDPVDPESRVTALFPELFFKAVVKVEKIQAEGITILADTEHKITPLILPEDADNKMLQWRSVNPNIVSVTDQGLVRGLKGGTAQVEISAMDGSGVTTIVPVTVINRSLTILGPVAGKTKETISLEAIYVTAGENLSGYRWEVKPNNGQNPSDMVTLHQNAKEQGKVEVTLMKKGTVTLVATALTDRYPEGAMSKEHRITVTESIDEIFIDGPSHVMVGDSIVLYAGTIPYNTDATQFIWSLAGEDRDYATLLPSSDRRSAVLTGIQQTDRIEVIISLSDNSGSPPLTAVKSIRIDPNLEGLHLSDTNIDIGGSENLLLHRLTVFPASFDPYLLNGRLTWSSSAPSVVSVNESGIVSGIKKGAAIITVTYTSPHAGQKKVIAKGTVKVNGQISNDRY